MKATRHNGRSGKHGSYNHKHNDRNFELEHSEHIDANMAMQNIYWDCYTGNRTAASKGNYESFDAIELRFYEKNYDAFVAKQNERNAMNRHTERNRTISLFAEVSLKWTKNSFCDAEVLFSTIRK